MKVTVQVDEAGKVLKVVNCPKEWEDLLKEGSAIANFKGEMGEYELDLILAGDGAFYIKSPGVSQKEKAEGKPYRSGFRYLGSRRH